MGDKERFEVLLEEVGHDVKTVAEGLVTLDEKVERGFQSLRQEFKSDMGGLRSDLRLYMKQTDRRFVLLEAKVK